MLVTKVGYSVEVKMRAIEMRLAGVSGRDYHGAFWT